MSLSLTRRYGRHETVQESNNNNVAIDVKKIEAIFDNQESSKFLCELQKVEINTLQDCCKKTISRLDKNVLDICVKSFEYYSVWQKERQFRITGSNSYALFTYQKNIKPDWKTKSLKYFYPKPINNCYVVHGIDNEPLARKAYEKSISMKVIECGLVVSRNNSWLGYSPDGIVFENDKPIKLIEIKCPYIGKKTCLIEVLNTLKYLVKENNGQFTLKTNHFYYAQVQIGMAVLNLPATDFIIYASFDNKFITISINNDEDYAKKLLFSLKKTYFNIMIHHVCEKENGEVHKRDEK